MKSLVKSMSGGQKGFTLIELLVVIAILGVIAAVVALNVAGFFGRGTLQAANTELHQAQTAIIAAMADAQTNVVGTNSTGGPETWEPWTAGELVWSGQAGMIVIRGTDGKYYDASSYIYGPFRAEYSIDATGAVVWGESDPANVTTVANPWGSGIFWSENDNWTDDPDQAA